MEPRAQTRPALPVAALTDPVTVTVVGWAYRVDYGPRVRPRWHTVHLDRGCQCRLGTACPAVGAVADYLTAGGKRAGAPPFDVWLQLPGACPICGGLVSPEPGLDSPAHGHGWRCRRTGLRCYWAARSVPLLVAGTPPTRLGAPAICRTLTLPAALAVVRGWANG